MKARMGKVLGLLLGIGLAFGAAGCASVDKNASGAYKAGTYQASARGNNGEVAVQVVVSDSKILSVKVLKHSETPGICDKAIANIPAAIVKKQTLAVDAVAGASHSSGAILAAAEACLVQAGGNMPALKAKKAEKAAAAGKTIEKSADIVIVGGGGAGLAAAVAASDKGASVILIEKMSDVGGNTLVCGGIYNCPDPDLQKPAGIDDSVELFIKQSWEAGDKLADHDLISALCENSYAGLKWLEGLGVQFKPTITMGAGSLYQRTHTSVKPLGSGFIEAYKANLAKKTDKVRILLETAGKSLIVKDGRVVGVNAQDGAGNKLVLRAAKGVILATGGFAGNVEMRQKYNTSGKWKDLGKNVPTTNRPGINGDGIVMASAIGAGLVDMEQIQLLHMGNPATGAISGICEPLGTAGTIFINQEGKRFVREDGRRDDMCAGILAQTNAKMYVIESGDAIPDPKAAKTLDGSPLMDWVNDGTIFMADTLEDLAKKIKVPADALKKTVDTYNASVDAGKDLDGLGRTLFKHKYAKGPWYANPRVPSVHFTMGGVRIDTRTRVLTEDKKVIPGLYAAGEVTGGVHGTNRVGGNAVVSTVVFGKIAGETAAQ